MTAIVLAAWFALVLQFYILVANAPGNGMRTLEAVGRFFLFFTILCNILVALSITALLLNTGSAAGRFFAKPTVITAVALYILIVGLVYNVLLRKVWHPQGLQKLADEFLHVVIPVVFSFYWVLFAPKKSLQWIHAFLWLVFPSLYLVYAMFRGGIEGFYPYPFLDANTLTFGRIFMNCVGLLFVFIIAGLLFVAASKRMDHPKDR